MSDFTAYAQEIQKKLGAEHNVFFFWKGRVALYAILRALGLKENDEVILPALTCVVVPNAIIYLGAKPVYVDVSPKTYNIEPGLIEDHITSRTKVILAQNTFGLSSDLDGLFSLAHKHGLWVIEDCAHGFGGTYKGKPNGTVADAAFFSTQWNKTFSTGIGGFAVTKDDALASGIQELVDQACAPGKSEKISLAAQMAANRLFLNQTTYWAALGTYRWLSKHNLVTGSSAGQELLAPEMPVDFLKKASRVQARRGIKEVQDLQANLAHRKQVASRYKQMCTQLGIEPPFEPAYAEHTFIKFPLLVKDRGTFIREAEKHRIELGDWFVSPIHPVHDQVHRWGYTYGLNPVAEALSQSLVNLPTHAKIDDRYLGKIESFLQKNRENIFFSATECLSWRK
jgi:dTDP-4-amino-4,6-dideoxygalactose transaminase